MVDYRNILRLQSQGHSQREIERELYCSRHTISEVLIRVQIVTATGQQGHNSGPARDTIAGQKLS